MVLNQVRAVFFDLDNTLIDTAGASRKGMLEVTSRLPRPSSRLGQRAHSVSRAFLSPWCLPTPDLSSAISADTTPGPGHPGGTGFSSFEATPPPPAPCRKERERRTSGQGVMAGAGAFTSRPAAWVTCPGSDQLGDCAPASPRLISGRVVPTLRGLRWIFEETQEVTQLSVARLDLIDSRKFSPQEFTSSLPAPNQDRVRGGSSFSWCQQGFALQEATCGPPQTLPPTPTGDCIGGGSSFSWCQPGIALPLPEALGTPGNEVCTPAAKALATASTANSLLGSRRGGACFFPCWHLGFRICTANAGGEIHSGNEVCAPATAAKAEELVAGAATAPAADSLRDRIGVEAVLYLVSPGTLHWEEAIQETKGGAANRKLAEECYFLWKSTRLQHMILPEDVKAMLTELRKEVRLLLLTNGDRQTQREKIEACACQSYFDAIVVGGEQKEEKPSPSIFYYCCNLLGVQPDDCVMVGDTLETDIQGGLNAGLKATVWINKNGIMPLKSSPMPHYIVSSVLELPAVLQSIDCTVSTSA
ncbi:N-acylneuraminate-9-phosphatase [Suricata suricatta]|uniref:N-acylneuraminate-9-phosphatase n=1 Tax=Suricata suricatta TaxID=37032 RepID=UPI00115580B5|nr:N-acylneuraminate-9-phosphatase [Suricata suricatta]